VCCIFEVWTLERIWLVWKISGRGYRAQPAATVQPEATQSRPAQRCIEAARRRSWPSSLANSLQRRARARPVSDRAAHRVPAEPQHPPFFTVFNFSGTHVPAPTLIPSLS
jgi:hypothetical protein